jgi:hypothetical protein
MRVTSIGRLVCLGLVLGVAAFASAREVEISLKDGRTIVGELVNETAQAVTVKVAGIETTFSRSQMKEGGLKARVTLTEQFEEKRAALAADDFNGRTDLARWALDQKTSEGNKLALAELDAILKARPDSDLAKTLHNIAADRLKNDPSVKPAPEKPTPEKPAPEKPEVAPADAPKGAPRILTPEEINTIKVYEVDLGRKPPPLVVVPPDVVDDLLKNYRDNSELDPFLGREGEKKFRTLDPLDKLRMIFAVKARDLYPRVQVRDEPANMTNFKTKVHSNYLLRRCGECHGEGKTPGLYVITQRAQQEATVYTNFLLVSRTVTSGGIPLVFKNDPDKSALLQFGLPRSEAVTPHPDVKGFKPYFTSRKDSKYSDVLDWIKGLFTDPLEYPIDFVPPGATPATAPVGDGAAPAQPNVPKPVLTPQPAGPGPTPNGPGPAKPTVTPVAPINK